MNPPGETAHWFFGVRPIGWYGVRPLGLVLCVQVEAHQGRGGKIQQQDSFRCQICWGWIVVDLNGFNMDEESNPIT